MFFIHAISSPTDAASYTVVHHLSVVAQSLHSSRSGQDTRMTRWCEIRTQTQKVKYCSPKFETLQPPVS